MVYAKSLLTKPAGRQRSGGLDEGSKTSLRQAVHDLKTVEAKVLGVVHHDAKVPEETNYPGYESRSYA